MTKVVVVTDPEAMEPVLDERGQEIVYRTDGEQVRGHMVPGAVNTSAVFTAADIGRWLAKEMFLSGGWDDGEDPRTDGFEWYMDDVDGEDEDELDDDEVDDGDDGYVLVDVD
ncbi:hypothetical protein OG280_41535 (plasmid) [Streptomyces virginiae]|uniref:hypothetical protein n=1 Tax=Streptomyces virginiae TaxID=1961 RepID=UPI002F917C85